ncbi:MAG: DNA alkylation repair protein [Pseudomonadota bacterium]
MKGNMYCVPRKELRELADPGRAKNSQRFFKTGPGEYGEGDRFLGITVPRLRALAKKHCDLSFSSLRSFLASPLHEERLFALMILVLQFQHGSKIDRKRIYDFYVRNLRAINNWDLVDLTAPRIVGPIWLEGGRVPIQRWVRSRNLWERRIAIVSTAYFIGQGRFSETLRISRTLLNDREDLIHKAVGWMLREVGKRNRPVLERFLDRHAHRMPRTMLRYAIERFSESERQTYLEKGR